MDNEEQNKGLVRRHLDLISAGDARGAAEFWAPECFNLGRRVDREFMRKAFESIVALHEHFTIHEMIAEGEWVAVRATVTGRYIEQPPLPVNSGIFSGLRPAGQTYSLQHMHQFKVVDGKIAEHWAIRDDLGTARQIGLELMPVELKRDE